MKGEGYRWSVRVSGGGSPGVRVFARRSQFDVGAAVEFDDEAANVSALEYALGALGAELATGLQRLALERRIGLDHVEAVVQGELNDPLAAIGVVGAEGHPGLESMRVTLYVSAAASEAELREAWEEVLKRSPLLRTFRAAARVDVALHLTA